VAHLTEKLEWRVPPAGERASVALRDVFGADLRAVCVVGSFLSEEAIVEHSAPSTNARELLPALRLQYSDSERISLYAFDREGRMVERYLLGASGVGVTIHPNMGGTMACHDPKEVIEIERGEWGRIIVTFPDVSNQVGPT
jgi:hypothetical protein